MEWIISANSSSARVYEVLSRNTIKPKYTLEHVQSRMKSESLVTDRPGQRAPHSFTESANPKEVEANRFAKHLADLIERARATNQFEQLVLVMPPEFLGLVSSHLTDLTKDLIRETHTKDYTKLPVQELQSLVYPEFDSIMI
jgi:protein required for attachment to host cells